MTSSTQRWNRCKSSISQKRPIIDCVVTCMSSRATGLTRFVERPVLASPTFCHARSGTSTRASDPRGRIRTSLPRAFAWSASSRIAAPLFLARSLHVVVLSPCPSTREKKLFVARSLHRGRDLTDDWCDWNARSRAGFASQARASAFVPPLRVRFRSTDVWEGRGRSADGRRSAGAVGTGRNASVARREV